MTELPSRKGGVVGGSLLIAGTSIGGGMLALPVLTSLGGFYPSLGLFLVCWLFMAATGLLILEACLWMEEDTNLVSMAGKTLGTPGKIAAWGLYLFLFYTLTIAYVSAGGALVSDLFGSRVPEWVGMFLFTGVFGTFVFLGARFVDRINWIMMLGLGVTYAGFVVLGFKHVDTDLLQHSNWQLSLLALPVAFTSFGFQGTVPTLVRYMQRDVSKLRLAILIGSFIPLVAYGVWEWLIHGVVPAEGPHGLVEAIGSNQTAVVPLKYFIKNPRITMIAEAFAFFAIVTSFLGVTLGLRDFLADGLQVEKNREGRILLCSIIFIPPILIAMGYPGLFLSAL
ncbi:Tyrosine-specific transport protein, partial [Chlamydiales bacterium SCGC AG-110-P3]